MQTGKKPTGDRRKEHNLDLVRRMRSGEPLNAIDSKASWYPPRPIIQKDRVEMARLYPHMAEEVVVATPSGPDAPVRGKFLRIASKS
jgi:hypothetical protein